ncbi:hypothetical protein DFH27DRAFT_601081 [Peziza echinospora]|nr:hypothetical protein DFH27DRAFT_601081 [Peziza echinospora]
MFFQGTPNEAIALTLQRGVAFACFLVDESEDATPENRQWEEEYLHDEEVERILKDKAVLYRITKGSVEAVNLFAYMPPPKQVPAMLIIRSDQTVERYENAGGLEEFRSWLKGVLDGALSAPPPPPVLETEVLSPPPQQQRTVTMAAQATTIPQTQGPVAPRAEEGGEQQVATAAADKGKGKAKEEANPSTSSSNTTKTPKQREEARREAHLAQQSTRNSPLGYLDQQRKRQLEAQEDRDRVRKLLEADKASRLAREKEERELREQQRAGNIHDAGNARMDTPLQGQRPARTVDSPECALSFRLLDGSALKHKFPANVKLGIEVRKWVDQNRTDETDKPYTFTQLLTPFPNKRFTLSDENSSLKDLELTPTATLVLVPGKMAQSSAYPRMGLIPSPWGIVGAVRSSVGAVLATGMQTVQSFVAGGGEGQNQQQQAGGQLQGGGARGATTQRGPGTPSVRGGGGASSRVRTLYDGNEGDGDESGRSGGTRFYNGNQLNFEPNQDGRDDR